MLLLFFAFGGYEAAMNPMGEARNPKRDAPFALFVALAIITVIYTVIQWVVVGVLPPSMHSNRPLAEVARIVLGPSGAGLVAIAAVVSVYGYLSANFLTAPRATFAFAEQGDFPRWFAAVHRRASNTPHLNRGLRNPVLGAGAGRELHLERYAVRGDRDCFTTERCARLFRCCAARQPEAAWFRIPAGSGIAVNRRVDLRCAVERRRFQQIADPDGYGGDRISELAGGAKQWLMK